MGHTRCGAVNASIDFVSQGSDPKEATGCDYLTEITSVIERSIAKETSTTEDRTSANEAFSNRVIELNVRETMRDIVERSHAMRRLVDEGRVKVVGAVYDVSTGQVRFLD